MRIIFSDESRIYWPGSRKVKKRVQAEWSGWRKRKLLKRIGNQDMNLTSNSVTIKGKFGLVSLMLCVPRKYYLIQQGKTWNEAQAYCQAINTDMAVIKSNGDLIQLQNESQRQQFSSSAWIGLYNDINSWRWSYGNEPLGNINFWSPPEPNNWHGEESCGMITPTGWNDINCQNSYPFVCFDGTKTGSSRYIYVSSAMSWSKAQQYCRQYYTDLASVHNATENSVLGGLIPGETWFGLFRDTWKWIDQTSFSTVSWITGQPDNYMWNENCAYIYNGSVGDAQCSNIQPFFCYSVKQQIIRVKVKSNRNVNDDATPVTILEQLRQKVEDNWIKNNITVKWREQPDGNVFYKEEQKSLD